LSEISLIVHHITQALSITSHAHFVGASILCGVRFFCGSSIFMS